MSIQTRESKGSALTHGEMDANFIGLADGTHLTASQKKKECSAWVNFDGTTTPPTIQDSFNVSDVVKVSDGVFEVVFETLMDNSNYCLTGGASYTDITRVAMSLGIHPRISPLREKVTIVTGVNGSLSSQGFLRDSAKSNVQIFGGGS